MLEDQYMGIFQCLQNNLNNKDSFNLRVKGYQDVVNRVLSGTFLKYEITFE